MRSFKPGIPKCTTISLCKRSQISLCYRKTHCQNLNHTSLTIKHVLPIPRWYSTQNTNTEKTDDADLEVLQRMIDEKNKLNTFAVAEILNNHMRSGKRPVRPLFNCAIAAFGMQKDFESAFKYWQLMQREGIAPNIVTLNGLLRVNITILIVVTLRLALHGI